MCSVYYLIMSIKMCVWVQPHVKLLRKQSFFFLHSHLSRLPPNPVAGCVHKKLHLFMFAPVRCLFSIREVDGATSGSKRALVSSQISNNFFWHTHILNTDAKTQRDCLILDSRAFNSPHTLPALTSLHMKTSLMNVLLGQLLRKWRFSSPALPPAFLPGPFLSPSPPPAHAPFWTCLFDSLRRC